MGTVCGAHTDVSANLLSVKPQESEINNERQRLTPLGRRGWCERIVRLDSALAQWMRVELTLHACDI
ncbi:uncharacterized protein PHALS_02849 [Plasmopara halstedii]|uniref:Uncharacterized protein n=1 Tax=Plasmopara halstedii TaxID=4781 RepID=A0A0P1AWQ3_PLAHL|nr:uncharacterized protein PHALS_02849 [Plasmopara halstedii]CEG46448.1 hypothetical protein PHALS_02849 [Plasmopara halstedii]|eukprot:XP_024582817.1 hypothetical protein PHALS_02849 [Plasmopara halstedii]